MILLLFYNQQPPPPSPSYVNFAVTLAALWTALNANGPQDAVFWSSDEMYQWFDQAAKLLGRTHGVFTDYDQSLVTVTNQGDYTLPDTHISTIQADLNGNLLRARNVQEMEAADANWPRTAGIPAVFLQDVEGMRLLTINPIPQASSGGLPIGITINEVPDTITAANAFLRAPQVLQEYFTFYALSEARTKESHAQMPEAAQMFGGIVDLCTQAISGLWGRDDG